VLEHVRAGLHRQDVRLLLGAVAPVDAVPDALHHGPHAVRRVVLEQQQERQHQVVPVVPLAVPHLVEAPERADGVVVLGLARERRNDLLRRVAVVADLLEGRGAGQGLVEHRQVPGQPGR
jgi:hypothetical protein